MNRTEAKTQKLWRTLSLSPPWIFVPSLWKGSRMMSFKQRHLLKIILKWLILKFHKKMPFPQDRCLHSLHLGFYLGTRHALVSQGSTRISFSEHTQLPLAVHSGGECGWSIQLRTCLSPSHILFLQDSAGHPQRRKHRLSLKGDSNTHTDFQNHRKRR